MKCKKILSAILSGTMAFTTAFSAPGLSALAAETDMPQPIASYDFENGIGEEAKAIVKGLGDYNGEIVYEEGRDSEKAVKLGDYGLKLNQNNLGENYTISLWVKPQAAIPNNTSLLFVGYHAPEQWVSIAGRGGASQCKTWTNNGEEFRWKEINTFEVPQASWTQLTLTQEGNTVTTYVNGAQVGSGTGAKAMVGENQDIYLGVNNWDTTFTGLMDDVKVYDVALSEEQVKEQYDGLSQEEILDKEGIRVSEAMTLMEGASGKISVTLPFGVTDAVVSYESDAAEIATVGEDGTVTAIAAGTANITTTAALGEVVKSQVTRVEVSSPDDTVNEGLAVEYDMNGSVEGKLYDTSGHGNHGVIHNPNTVEFVTDEGRSVMNIKDAASYIDLPMGIADALTDKEQFTIEATYSRSANAGGTSWLFCFGSIPKETGSNYLFYCPYFSFGNGQVRAGIKNSRDEELFTTEIQNKNDTYYTVNMVFNHGTITLYLDGVKIGGQLDSGYSVADDVINGGTADGILGYLGKSCWAQDTNFVGKIASFKIYNKALSDDEVQNANPEFQANLQKKLNEGIQAEDLLGSRNESPDQVWYDLSLPALLEELDVTWTSSDTSVITNDGKVHNGSEDKSVTLTATVTSGVLTAAKDFVFTVKAMNRGELDELLAKASEALKNPNLSDQERAMIQEAIDQAEEITNQAEVAAAVFQLKKAIGIVEYQEISVDKSAGGNPIAGFSDSGEVTYAGDPSILVDGDTVYLYVGHDVSTAANYVMPNYFCYSTKDMKEWKFEGEIMKMTDVVWGDNNSAWAGQVMKHNGKYYLYFCSWNNQDGGKQSIGVAVSDSPTGPFVDKGEALIKGSVTEPQSSNWNDIDPTAWIETDENGEEHIYLAWGNSKWYMCELNDDMVSVKDQNGDGRITMNQDIWEQSIVGMDGAYTEAPYLYRQQDEDGNYYGKYYMFYAMNWREEMAYCTKDDINDFTEPWVYGGKLMPPTATANTNHPAVFDFKGSTYFIYHNGSLPWGSGYRRVACVEEFTINEDGTIDPIQETSTGLTGTGSRILDFEGAPVAHENWENTLNDADYPITKSVGTDSSALQADATWEILPGKADKGEASYVSIQSYNKPGLYLSVQGEELVLTQDADRADGQGITKDSASMTFRTLKGFAGSGVTLESVAKPGYYVISEGGKLVLSQNPDLEKCTFTVKGGEEILDEESFTVTDTLNVMEGKSSRIKVTLPAGVANADISYAADDSSVVSVSKNGTVTGVKAGTAVVKTTVTLGKVTKQEETRVTVEESPIEVDESLAAFYTMEGASDGKLIDASGHGNDAAIRNPENVEFINDNGKTVMNIKNAESYVELPMGIMDALTDKEQFTIEATYSRSVQAGGTSWLFCLGSIPKGTGTNYLFYCPYFSFGNGEVRAGIKNSSTERLFETGIRNENDTYYTVNMVFNKGTITLYLDGMKIGGELNSGYSIVNDVINGGTAGDVLGYIGKSCWAQDTNFVGKVSSFKVYNKAMNDADVQNSNPEYQKRLQEKLDEGLQEKDLLGSNEDTDHIVYDLVLPGTLDETQIIWTSSNPAVVSSTGKVYNGAKDETVILTAEAISGVLSAKKSFTITVKAMNRTELEAAVAEAKAAAENPYWSDESLNILKKALESAQSAASQTEADAAVREIERAIEKLDYKKEYKDPISSLEGNQPAAAVELKEKDTLTVFTVPAAIRDMVTVSYESSVPAVAAYTNGVLTAGKAGTATLTTIVTAKYDGYAVRYRTRVTVKAAEPEKTGVDLSKVTVKAAKTKIAKGKTTRVKITLPAEVQAASPKITYKAKGAVSVTSAGKIKGKKAGKGTVTVTVSAGGRSISKQLTVKVGAVAGKSSVKAGKTITLKVKGVSSKVKWSVNKKKLAKISKKGKLTAKKKGKIVVTAKASGVTMKKTIKIK